MSANRTRVIQSWGETAPDWMLLLADACDASSQRQIAERLGRSSGYVNRLLFADYTGDLVEAEKIVRAHLQAEKIACPALAAAISQEQCLHYRRGSRGTHAGLRRHLDDICPSCPHNADRETRS